MKKHNIILTFIPWIVLSTSNGYANFLTGAIIALILNIIIARDYLLKGVILEIGGTIFFGLMVLAGLFLHDHNTFAQYPNLWSNIAMTIIMLGSVGINKPFTEQYTNKGNHQLHMHLSIIWGVLLLITTGVSIAHVYLGLNNTLSTIGTVAAILIGIKANVFYPKWFYRKQIQNNLSDLLQLK